MTNPIRTRLAYAAATVLALFAGSAIAAGSTQQVSAGKVALVVAGSAAHDKTLLAQAHATGADLRVVRTTAEQLGVTHMLAARGYDTIVTVGVDRRIAVAPLVKNYPHTRFVAAKANGLGTAMSGAE